MNEAKQNLAAAVRDARTGLGLSQEKLAEILNIDSRTILNIEAGRGNPKPSETPGPAKRLHGTGSC